MRTSLSSKISKTNSKTVTIKCVTETGEDENVSIYCHIKSFLTHADFGHRSLAATGYACLVLLLRVISLDLLFVKISWLLE